MGLTIRDIRVNFTQQTQKASVIRFFPVLTGAATDVLLEKEYKFTVQTDGTIDATGDTLIGLPSKSGETIRYDYEFPRFTGKSKGYFYLDAGAEINLGDLLIAGTPATDSVKTYIDNALAGASGAVSSVNGKTGAVTLNTIDISDTFDKRYVTDAEKALIGSTVTAGVSDTVYGSGWNGVANVAPSQNAVYDKIELLDAAKQNTIADSDSITQGATNLYLTTIERTKLTGIASGATVNDTDANLKNRANHTGTQTASTVSDFASAVIASVLTGFAVGSRTAVTATDTILQAFAKIQKYLNDLSALAFSGNASDLSGTKTNTFISDFDTAVAANATVSGKQDALVSGTSIKTINGSSLLGSGDLAISGGGGITANSTDTLTNKTISGSSNTLSNITQGSVTNLTSDLAGKQDTLVSATNIKTVNGSSLLGSGNLAISAGIANIVEDTTPQLGGNLDLNSFTVGAASAADLTKLNAVTASAAELNYSVGVTSAIQTQINGKQATITDSDDIAEGAANLFLTPTERTKLTNTSGTNSGDQDISGLAVKANNLSDLASATSARSNLGLVIGTNVQAQNGDLSAIAGLSPTNDDILQRKSGAWTNRTISQLKTDLSLAKADVGLGNADNTSDANKPVSTAQQTALDLKANLASPAFTGTVSGISATMVGLGNVDNTSDATKNSATATLTNKTLTAPVLGGTITGTYTLGGTPTFPSSVATLTGSQTFTNKTLTAPVISTISNTGTITLPTATDTLVGRATTDTLTNKRVTSRVGTTASSSTPTPNADTDDMFTVTALAANATFGAPSGTPTAGQPLIIRIKDNGTPRTLAFNAIYRAIGITLPTTTVASKTIYLGMIFNNVDSKWDILGYNIEA